MKRLKHALLAATVALCASVAQANVITFNLNGSINGTAPSGAANPSWLSASVTDIGTGQVQLVMSSYLPSGEYVDDWLFNVSSSVTGLTVKHSADYSWGSVVLSQTNGASSIKAGEFDLSFGSANDNQSRFASNGTSTYLLSGSGLSTASFLTLSSSDGKNTGGYYSAADVKGIGNGGSGSVGTKTYSVPAESPVVSPVAPVLPQTDPVARASDYESPVTNVPEPGSIALYAIGLLSLAFKRRQR